MKTFEAVWDSKRKDLTLKVGDVVCGMRVIEILRGKYIKVEGVRSTTIVLKGDLMELRDALRPLGIKEIITDEVLRIGGNEFDGWGLIFSFYGICVIDCEKMKNVSLVDIGETPGQVRLYGGSIGINTLKRGVFENVNMRTNTITRNNNIFPILKGKNEIRCSKLVINADKLPIGKLKSDGVRALGLTEKFLDSTGAESLGVNLIMRGKPLRTYAYPSENWAIDIE